MLQKTIKTIFNAFGFSIIRISTPNDYKKPCRGRLAPLRFTMGDSLRHLSYLGFQPNVIIDVGVADGTWPLMNAFPSSRFLWIEPLSEYEDSLKKLSSIFRGNYLLAAAGRQNGKVKINVHCDLTGSSLFKELDSKEADGFEREVAMVRLDDLIEPFSLKGSLLLKVDVQGAELEVLGGAEQLLRECEVVILETSFFNFQKGSPDFFDIITFMKSKGFVVYDLFDGHNRPIDNALAQKDVLFVKEKGFLRKTHNWSTDDQRQSYHRYYRKRAKVGH
jgi:FkbM family methyltransferase